MPITTQQKQTAERQQQLAAQENATQVRLIAGPGTGKSHVIEQRVAYLLDNHAIPSNIYVISFTRASCEELSERIRCYCSRLPCANAASQVKVSTMHSLALKILRMGNLLNSYPSTPIMLDDWEQSNVYDRELASRLGCNVRHASEIRFAYDAEWQTLNQQPTITPAERIAFSAFHNERTNLYSCVLPGEVIHKCVVALQNGDISSAQLPQIDHLIVDEFQDLNACDQEFIKSLCAQSSTNLFVAGDDDQSIYSFRHANPNGIINFPTTYPSATTHMLTDCFRCAPAILSSANNLIAYNAGRVPKNLNSLYANATPPVQGKLFVWSFQNVREEAQSIATSCQELIAAGMRGREDEIIILISNRRVQLDILAQELGNLGIPYDAPNNATLKEEHDSLMVVYTLLRLLKEDSTSGQEDYPAHRDLLGLLSGVGHATAKGVADGCISNNQNFRQLFYMSTTPTWLQSRCLSAVQRVMAVIQLVRNWTLNDTLTTRSAEITQLLATEFFTSGQNALEDINIWNALASSLPVEMTLDELLQFLTADSEPEQQTLLEKVTSRITQGQTASPAQAQKRVRILTMHGAKGLSGQVVFIPGIAQGIMPSFRAIQITNQLIEQRRLFYVSLTRARACCIISHVSQYAGAQAMSIAQRSFIRLSRSQFLNEMNAPSVTRQRGLTSAEAISIVVDVNNL